MAAKESTMLALGTQAPDFNLPDFDGKLHRLSDFNPAKGLVVAFICNHCPYVQHIGAEFSRFAAEYQGKGLGIVAIMSNDLQAFPQDGPAGMRAEARAMGYTFPYLLDEAQSVAKAYQAACTPDIYVFDGTRKLFYRGQFDSSRPRNSLPVNGADLRIATEALLGGKPAPSEQIASIGCSIKWRAGNEPGYA
jgi:peroxiredoxin